MVRLNPSIYRPLIVYKCYGNTSVMQLYNYVYQQYLIC